MKKYLFLLFLPVSLIAQTITGPGPYYTGVQITSVGTNSSGGLTTNTGIASSSGFGTNTTLVNPTLNGTIGGTGIVPIANGGTGTNTARAASTSIGVAQMSATIGGNYFNDMTNFADQFSGQLGLAMDSPTTGQAALYSSFGTSGTGTNVWAQMPFGFPQGIRSAGNGNFAGDLPSLINQNTAAGQSTTFYYQYGHRASTLAAAYGYKDTNNPSNITQPQIRFIDGNPWSGAPFLGVMAAFTNSIYGGLIGTNDEGTPIYIDQFGFSIGEIGDAYRIGEKNQTPSDQIIGNNDNLPMYISHNSGRPGDSSGGQISQEIFDWKPMQGSGYGITHFPLQIPNVWMPSNANYQDAFEIIDAPIAYSSQAGGGALLIATNSTLIVSNFYGGGFVRNQNGTFYNGLGKFDWGAQSGNDDTSEPFVVNTSAMFDLPVNGVVAWDKSIFGRRSGLVFGPGSGYPALAYAGAGELDFYSMSGSDLTVNLSGQTATKVMMLDVNGTVQTPRGIGSSATTAALTIVGTGITNTMGIQAIAHIEGVAVSYVVKNGAGTATWTNVTISATSSTTEILQPNGAITAASGLSGRVVPF